MIRNLETVSVEELHDAFVDAFSNYESKMDLSVKQLSEMLTTRSYNAKFSRGFFDNGHLVGFLLVGYRVIDGVTYFYDTATGTRQNYQKQGIGDALLKEIKNEMKIDGIDTFVLEVLEHNVAAQELYKKNGFIIKRKLNCFTYTIEDKDDFKTIEIDYRINHAECADVKSYCSFEPSWQNSNISYNNSKELNTKIDYYYRNKMIGYLICNKESGNIMQLGLDKEYRTIEILANILNHIKVNHGIKKIKLLNIEDGSGIDTLLHQFGFNNFINQYEMELVIK